MTVVMVVGLCTTEIYKTRVFSVRALRLKYKKRGLCVSSSQASSNIHFGILLHCLFRMIFLFDIVIQLAYLVHLIILSL